MLDRLAENPLGSYLSGLILFIFLSISGCELDPSGNGGSGDPDGLRAGPGAAGATIILGDNPHPLLVGLELEITELAIVDTAGGSQEIFKNSSPSRFNLQRYAATPKILGETALSKNQTYDRLTFKYQSAKAVDVDGESLNLSPTQGSVTVELDEPFTYTSGAVYIPIDFDVDLSTASITSGSGGSLTLKPALSATQSSEATVLQLDDYFGVVRETDSSKNSVTMDVYDLLQSSSATPIERIVHLDDDAAVLAAGSTKKITDGDFDLAKLLPKNAVVDIVGGLTDGAFTAQTIEVVADVAVENLVQAIGLVAEGAGATSFKIVVLESRNSGFTLGSTQTISFGNETQFAFADGAIAGASSLNLGQVVRVVGDAAGSTALSVRLMSTQLHGTVTALNSGARQLTLQPDQIEQLNTGTITGFPSSLTLQFTSTLPSDLAINGSATFRGRFNQSAAGVFDVGSSSIDDATVSFSGSLFSLLSASPLALTLSGDGTALGLGNPVTIRVELPEDGRIIEVDATNLVCGRISGSAFVTGLGSTKYGGLQVRGTYSSTGNTLTATDLRADLL